MTPLDLSKTPPRSPRERLDGLTMLPRTIDKLRALLPGGNPGDYAIAGFSQRLLDAIEVREEQLRDVVAKAAHDQDVVDWLRTNARTEKYAEISTFLENRKLGDVSDREEFGNRYPISRSMPDDALLIDMLDRDDAAAFPAKN